jgi:type I restriction enzyme S subunit
MRLEDVSNTITKGTTPTTYGYKYQDYGVKFIKIENIDEYGNLNFEAIQFISEETHDFLSRSKLKNGDILFSIAGALGRCAIVDENVLPANINQALALIRIKDDDSLNLKYLVFYLRTLAQSGFFSKLKAGVAQLNLSLSQVKTFPIPLPPLPTQHKIVEILEEADNLRKLRQLADEKMKELIPSLFVQMFGDPTTNPKGWEKVTFGHLVKNEDGKRIPLKDSDRRNRQGIYPYYGASGIIDYIDDYIFDGEKLLIAEDGANLVARVTPIAFIASGKFWVNNHAHVVSYNGRADLQFLCNLINLINIKGYISGSAQPKLNQSNLNRIFMILPPLPVQQEFVNLVKDIEAEKTRQAESKKKLDELFQSLMQRAFTGELVT